MNVRASGLALAVLAAALWAGQARGEAPASADCAKALARASLLNGMELFGGAGSCAEAQQREDSNLLIILGRIRAISDLTVFTPSDDAARTQAGNLYAALYYQFGGLGFDEVYRSPATVDALEERIRAVDLGLAGYDPGWAYRPASKTDIYAAVVSDTRETRLWQMRTMALRLQDDAYYEAYQALLDLQRQHPTLQAGSPAYEEYLRLTRLMEEAAEGIPELPPPEETVSRARLNEQDPDLAARQVAQGFDGPAKQGVDIFRSAAEVRGSWLAAALSEREVDALLGRTDFSSQVLMAFAFGQRMNASGEIILSGLSYSGPGYSIATRLGVVPESCGVAFAESYPFVVGVADVVAGTTSRGTSTSNFPADCGPVVSGTATDLP